MTRRQTARATIDAAFLRAYKNGMDVKQLARRHTAILAGLLGPVAACAALAPFRTHFPNADAALALVAVIVAVAALGNRPGGIVGAVSAAVWFDFFLTTPYERLTINTQASIETTVLLLVIGISVTELAAWGRRQHRHAAQQLGYLAGLHAAAEVVSRGSSPTRLTAEIAEQLTDMLELESCRFHFGSDLGSPRLQHDGQLTWTGRPWDIDLQGFPPDVETELIVTAGGRFHGRFLMTPNEHSQPGPTQRLVAVALADQVGAALGEYNPSDL